jgi:hypothetical protein
MGKAFHAENRFPAPVAKRGALWDDLTLRKGRAPMTYVDLLAAAQADPAGADYHALRMAYAHSDRYDPYTQAAEQVEGLRAALQAGNMAEALDAVEALLDFNYLDIETHMTADYLYTRLDQHDGAAYHRTFAQGLIRAVMATGTGHDPETAFVVLAVREEYLLLRLLGYRPSGQRLLQEGGHWIDVIDAQQRDTGEPTQFYFNVDLPRGWLSEHLES